MTNEVEIGNEGACKFRRSYSWHPNFWLKLNLVGVHAPNDISTVSLQMTMDQI